MTSPSIETDLSKILDQINQNLTDFRKETSQRFDNINERLTKLEVGQARLEERLTAVEKEVKDTKDDIKDIRTSQRNQIWALIGILGTAIVGIAFRFIITASPTGQP